MAAPRIRPLVRRLHAYVPGEQPKIRGLIKLNTNENPYPPSPKVLAAIARAADERLRLYPNPTADPLRKALATLHGCSPAEVFVGNGSDECLALAIRTFVEPASGARRRRPRGASVVQYFTPSYSLYPVLAATHGAATNEVPLEPDFGLPSPKRLAGELGWRQDAALTLITTPNAPSGRAYRSATLAALCRNQQGVTILDEAYVDFADSHAMAVALRTKNVLVARTFSKAYSLCALRVGYLVGDKNLIAALDKMRDSYNVNGLGQVAAVATLGDLGYYRRNLARVKRTRTRLARALEQLGFEVWPSQTNFLLAKPPVLSAKTWLDRLRSERVLVRWFGAPRLASYLRVTVGTDAEAEALVRAARRILARTTRENRA